MYYLVQLTIWKEWDTDKTQHCLMTRYKCILEKVANNNSPSNWYHTTKDQENLKRTLDILLVLTIQCPYVF